MNVSILCDLQDISRPTVPEVSIIFDKPKPATQIVAQPSKLMSYKEWKQQQMPFSVPSTINNRPLQVDVTHSRTVNKRNVKFEGLKNGIEMASKSIVQTTTTPSSDLELSVFDNQFRQSTNDATNFTETNRNNAVPLINPILTAYRQNDGVTSPPTQPPTHELILNDLYQLILLQKTQNEQKPQENVANAAMYNQKSPFNVQQTVQTHFEPTINDICKLMFSQQIQATNSNCNSNNIRRAEQIKSHSHTPNGIDNYGKVTHVPNNQQNNNNYQSQNNNANQKNQISSVNQPETSDEPTIKDLFKIIIKQQEQLLRLQEQVQNIISRDNENALRSSSAAKQIQDKQTEPATMFENCAKTVGVMTSLEINVQRPINQVQDTRYEETPVQKQTEAATEKHKCQCNCQSKNDTQMLDSTQPYDVIRNNQPAIRSPVSGEDRPGWTFYGNILEQVNDVLHSSPPVNKSGQRQETLPSQSDEFNGPAVMTSNIRMAQFKQIGFQFDDVNISATAKR